MLRKVKVNGICNFVIDLAVDGKVRLSDNMSILRLWVEHHPSNRVVFTLYSNDELCAIMSVCCQDIKELL